MHTPNKVQQPVIASDSPCILPCIPWLQLSCQHTKHMPCPCLAEQSSVHWVGSEIQGFQSDWVVQREFRGCIHIRFKSLLQPTPLSVSFRSTPYQRDNMHPTGEGGPQPPGSGAAPPPSGLAAQRTTPTQDPDLEHNGRYDIEHACCNTYV